MNSKPAWITLICQSILHCTACVVTRMMSFNGNVGRAIYCACLLLMKSDDLFLGKIPSYSAPALWPCSMDLSPALPKILATPLRHPVYHRLIFKTSTFKVSTLSKHQLHSIHFGFWHKRHPTLYYRISSNSAKNNYFGNCLGIIGTDPYRACEVSGIITSKQLTCELAKFNTTVCDWIQ